MSQRIIVTGGSGKAGRYVIQHLINEGHQVLNIDLAQLTGNLSDKVHTLKVDLTNGGQVFSAFSSYFRHSEPFEAPTKRAPDAVIHLAGYARNMIVSENETFAANITATFNVIEAACKLGVRKLVLASSVCVYGVTYAEGDVDFASFPIDETTDVRPTDAYSISKLCGENVAQGFARRFGCDIYALRIGAVITPDEHQKVFENYINNPDHWKAHGWSYIDARDLGQIFHLCVVKDGLGFQVFNATNNDITNTTDSTTEFLKRVCPKTPFTRELGPREAPMSNKKVKELLEFQEEYPWRRFYTL